MKTPLSVLALAIVATFVAFTSMAEELINSGEDGLAVQGYDTVAYFTEGRPVVGSAEHEVTLHGVRWRFSQAANMDLFLSDPEAYMPRYGGFCSGAMSRGFRATIDPEAFTIIDGKLYLAFSRAGIDEFDDDSEITIPAADENWKTLGQVD